MDSHSDKYFYGNLDDELLKLSKRKNHKRLKVKENSELFRNILSLLNYLRRKKILRIAAATHANITHFINIDIYNHYAGCILSKSGNLILE